MITRADFTFGKVDIHVTLTDEKNKRHRNYGRDRVEIEFESEDGGALHSLDLTVEQVRVLRDELTRCMGVR